MAQPEGINVRLGPHEYRVQPQRHAYLKREMRKFVDSLSALEDMEADQLLDIFTMKAYEVLSVFIPDLMERYEFQGFATREAFESGDYNEEYDRSPTIPEITVALNAAIDVNGLRFIGKVKDFFDPTLLRSQLNATVARWAAEQRKKMTVDGGGTSQRLPSANGGTHSMSSEAPEPTPEPPTEVVDPSGSATETS